MFEGHQNAAGSGGWEVAARSFYWSASGVLLSRDEASIMERFGEMSQLEG